MSKPCGGRFVQAIQEGLNLSNLYSSMDLLERSAIFQFIETRETLEVEIAYLVAKRAMAEDVQKLEKIIRNMK